MGDRVHPEVRRTATEVSTMEICDTATVTDVAARALRTQATESDAADTEAFRARLHATAQTPRGTRPTAVSLPNALRYVLCNISSTTVKGLRQSVVDSTDEFCARLEQAQAGLGQVGVSRLRDDNTIMTHCYSTGALACVEATIGQGKRIEAVVKETRPRNQEHIAMKRLRELGVPITLIIDSAAHRYLSDMDHVLVGADAVAADGSVINKIGMNGLAVNARERGTPIMIATQTLKLHPRTMTGHTVDIEIRSTAEVVDDDTLADLGNPTMKDPAFDVTPSRYVGTIVTEREQLPPESIVILMRELFGEGTSGPWAEPSPWAEP